jgi:hypothetical protein
MIRCVHCALPIFWSWQEDNKGCWVTADGPLRAAGVCKAMANPSPHSPNVLPPPVAPPPVNDHPQVIKTVLESDVQTHYAVSMKDLKEWLGIPAGESLIKMSLVLTPGKVTFGTFRKGKPGG